MISGQILCPGKSTLLKDVEVFGGVGRLVVPSFGFVRLEPLVAGFNQIITAELRHDLFDRFEAHQPLIVITEEDIFELCVTN